MLNTDEDLSGDGWYFIVEDIQLLLQIRYE